MQSFNFRLIATAGCGAATNQSQTSKKPSPKAYLPSTEERLLLTAHLPLTSVGEIFSPDGNLISLLMELTAIDGSQGTLTIKPDHDGCSKRTIDSVVVYGVSSQPTRATRSDGEDITAQMTFDPDYQMLDFQSMGLNLCNQSLSSIEWR